MSLVLRECNLSELEIQLGSTGAIFVLFMIKLHLQGDCVQTPHKIRLFFFSFLLGVSFCRKTYNVKSIIEFLFWNCIYQKYE